MRRRSRTLFFSNEQEGNTRKKELDHIGVMFGKLVVLKLSHKRMSIKRKTLSKHVIYSTTVLKFF